MGTSACTASSELIVLPLHAQRGRGSIPGLAHIGRGAMMLLLLRVVARRRRRAAARRRLVGAARPVALDSERLHRPGVELSGRLHALRFLEIAKRLLGLRAHPAVNAAGIVALVLQRLLRRLHPFVARTRHAAGATA